jgi:hypothetical protein
MNMPHENNEEMEKAVVCCPQDEVRLLAKKG